MFARYDNSVQCVHVPQCACFVCNVSTTLILPVVSHSQVLIELARGSIYCSLDFFETSKVSVGVYCAAHIQEIFLGKLNTV